jgi:hypothetical protein
LNGDGDFNTDPFEKGATLLTRTVKYSADPDSPTNVQLEETVANRRKDYSIGLKISSSTDQLICKKDLRVRVALGTNKGTGFGGGSAQAQLDRYK